MKALIATVALSFLVPTFASAQGEEHQYRGQGYFFFGLGTAGIYPGSSQRLIEHIGFGGEGFLYKDWGVGIEAGYAHWGYPAYWKDAWVASGDVSYHFGRNAPRGGVDPFVLLGVTAYFPASEGRGAPASNFGGGLNIWVRKHAALRVEVRDHVNTDSYSNGWPGTHYVSFRVGMTFR